MAVKKKITDLTNLTTPALADLLEIVDDVAGTPTSKKVTLEKIKDLLVDATNVNAVEADPIVGAITGIVKADGGGNISAATEDTDYQGVPTEGAFADGDKTKLDNIEDSADVTDETNVTDALDGATLTDVAVAVDDKVLIQDTDDGDNLKTVTTQEIADLASGGASQFDATVGATGADYETVKAAVDAGKVNLLIIDDTTETADIAVPAAGLDIYIARGQKIGMATYVFTFAGNYDLTIKGEGEIETSYVGTAAILFNSLVTTGVITLEGITIDNATANTTDSYINGTGNILKVNNVKVLLGTSYNCGFRLNNASSFIKNTWIVGGGANNDKVITSSSAGATIDGLTLTGSFRSGGYVLSGEANWNNITENASTGMRLGIGGQINNVVGLSGQACHLYLNQGTDSVVNNFNVPTGNILLTDDSLQISNSICLTVDATSGEPRDCKYSNVEVRGNVAIEGAYNQFSNCRIEGNLSMANGGAVVDDSNSVVGCVVTGTIDINGGNNHRIIGCDASTVDIAAGVNRCLVSACHVDTAPTDAGTDSSLDYVVY